MQLCNYTIMHVASQTSRFDQKKVKEVGLEAEVFVQFIFLAEEKNFQNNLIFVYGM